MLLTLWDEILSFEDDSSIVSGVLKFLTTEKDSSERIEDFGFLSSENDSTSTSKFGVVGLEILSSKADSSCSSKFGVDGLEFLSSMADSSCTSNFGVDGLWILLSKADSSFTSKFSVDGNCSADLPNRFSNFSISEFGTGINDEGMLGGNCVGRFGAEMNDEEACLEKENGVALLKLRDDDGS